MYRIRFLANIALSRKRGAPAAAGHAPFSRQCFPDASRMLCPEQLSEPLYVVFRAKNRPAGVKDPLLTFSGSSEFNKHNHAECSESGGKSSGNGEKRFYTIKVVLRRKPA